MPEKSKTKRRYDSTRRKAQARATRRQIVEAARELFNERGYAGTTMDAIAQQAGVAVETIYASFGNKRAVLKRLVDVSLVGDDQEIPLLNRPGPQAVMRERDQHRQVRMFAHDISEIMGRVAVLFEVMRTAAKTEPEIAELLQEMLENRLAGMRVFIQSLVANGPLREGLTESEAAESVWALTSAEIYRLLTEDRQWPAEEYEHWLGDTLTRLLLP